MKENVREGQVGEPGLGGRTRDTEVGERGTGARENEGNVGDKDRWESEVHVGDRVEDRIFDM